MTNRNVWLVERSRLFRQGLAMLMNDADLKVTREIQHLALVGRDGGEVPAIVIVSLETDLESGGTETRELERICALSAPVVVLSDVFALGQLVTAMRVGVHGYLMKDITPAALLQSLRLVLSGEKVMPTDLVATLLDGKGMLRGAVETGVRLSPRETDILRCLAQGFPNKKIALELGIGEGMVKFEIKKIFRKIRARDRTEAALWARGKQFNECLP